jgi:hypothetical protein
MKNAHYRAELYRIYPHQSSAPTTHTAHLLNLPVGSLFNSTATVVTGSYCLRPIHPVATAVVKKLIGGTDCAAPADRTRI